MGLSRNARTTLLPVSMQAVKERLVAGPCRSRLVEHYQVEPFELVSMHPERFADDAFQSVTPDGATTMLPGNGQAESSLAAAVFLVENRKHHVAASFRVLEDAAVGSRVGQPALPPEAAVCRFAFCLAVFRW
jgi:hypothetical protein